MKRRLALLAFVFAFASTPALAQTTLTLHFSRPELTLRTGAVQPVSARGGGWAPYAEGQVLTRLGHSAFGMAAHAGLSYERHERTALVTCLAGFSSRFIGPCPDLDERATYLDLVSGVRAGFFPARGPVDLFVGLASHAVRRSRRTVGRGADRRTDWRWHPTLQAGADVRFALTSRFDAGTGIVGFLPIRGEHRARFGEDMSRLGAHLSLRYDL